jgi:HAD superfamily hydrolase (TIGR01509 family)
VIKAVLFDLDGTLRDSLKPLRKAYDNFLADFGRQGSDGEFDALNGPNVSEIVARLAATHGLQLSATELEGRYLEHQRQSLASGAPLHAGARSLLNHLQARGFSLGLVTSSMRGEVASYLNGMEITCFQVIVCGDDVQRAKPDPAGYQLAVKRMQVQISQCVAVEDAPNGVTAAKKAGLRVVAVAHHLPSEQLLACGADAVGTDLRHVLDILEMEFFE